MAEYTIEAVAKEIREYQSQFGTMKSYKVKLTGELDPVEISQKPETPAPQVGDVINGTINDGQYGKKFKKDFQAGGGPGGKAGVSKAPFDTFTMYLSYAKDIVVAHINAQTKEGVKLGIAESVDATIAEGHRLYQSRPEAQGREDDLVKNEPKEVKTNKIEPMPDDFGAWETGEKASE